PYWSIARVARSRATSARRSGTARRPSKGCGVSSPRAALPEENRMRTCVVLVLLTTMGALAQAAEPQAGAKPDPALVDAIVRKLESDGTLDRAVERAITRVIQRQEEARKSTEVQRQAQAQERGKTARKVDSGRDHIRGEASAEVSLIEYSDFECPFCKSFHGTPMALMGRYAGRINWVYRHYPLDFHNPAARREAIASECAAQIGGKEAFWQYADAVFNQTQSDGKGLPVDNSVEVIAARLGMNRARFMRCLEDPVSIKRVNEDLVDGAGAGISGTPTTLIRNNRTGATEMIVGAQPPEALIAAAERILRPGIPHGLHRRPGESQHARTMAAPVPLRSESRRRRHRGGFRAAGHGLGRSAEMVRTRAALSSARRRRASPCGLRAGPRL